MKRVRRAGDDGRVHSFVWNETHACWFVECDAYKVMDYAPGFTKSPVNCLRCVYNLMRGSP